MKWSKPLAEQVKRIHGDDIFHSLTRHEVQNLHSQLERLEELAITKSPKDTEEAHLLKIEAAGKKLLQRKNKLWETIQERARTAIADIESQMRSETGMVSTEHSAEIRSALRTMHDEDRNDFIREAIARKDGGVIRSIEEAPAMLSGLNPETQSKFVQDFLEKHSPDLISQSKQVMESMTTALGGLHTVQRAVNEGLDPTRLQQIKDQETRHEEAQRSFDEGF